eukprot:TRINITY_DN33086_c0_g1_i1.p2 TRINITY_DN33086_c0_g1~~TRINITY_DN33086_c0_g1_i1.p2  ORF type:complete len:102 (+),score=25.50 TRINITY_DN33086_c0_g1_i1:301-606(+)
MKMEIKWCELCNSGGTFRNSTHQIERAAWRKDCLAPWVAGIQGNKEEEEKGEQDMTGITSAYWKITVPVPPFPCQEPSRCLLPAPGPPSSPLVRVNSHPPD